MLNEMCCIYTVYQERSFSKAAAKLHLTQPALSVIVKKVENEINYPIFDRSTMPLTLTPHGKFYIDSIKTILDIENNMLKYYKDLSDVEHSTLALGGSSYFCSFVFPKLIPLYQKQYPNAKVEMFEGNLSELTNGLENNKLDLVFETAISSDDSRFTTYLYDYENIILGVPSNWDINKKLKKYQLPLSDIKSKSILNTSVPAVPLLSFKDYPFIRLKADSDQWKRGMEICKHAGFVPISYFQLDQMLTAFIVANTTKSGALFVRDSLVCNFTDMISSLTFYRIDNPLAIRKVLIARKKKRFVTTAMKDFLKLALQDKNLNI
jgi:DNA-binding transcriptional LysR family regulator